MPRNATKAEILLAYSETSRVCVRPQRLCTYMKCGKNVVAHSVQSDAHLIIIWRYMMWPHFVFLFLSPFCFKGTMGPVAGDLILREGYIFLEPYLLHGK